MKIRLFHLLSSLLLIAALPLTGQAAANFSLAVHARNSFSNFGAGDIVADSYYLSSSVYLAPFGYRLTSAGGTVTTSSNGYTGSSTPLIYSSLADFVAAETGVWTLTKDVGGPGEIDYFFNVGFGTISPEPLPVRVHRTPGGTAGQWTADISGPVDEGAMTVSYFSSSDNGFYTVPSGTTSVDLTIDPASLFLSVSTYRFFYTSEFTISTPTTADGVALADWTLSPYNGYSEGGSLFLLPLPPAAVPDSANTIGMVLIGLGALVAGRRGFVRASA